MQFKLWLNESDLSYLLDLDIPQYTGPEKHYGIKDNISKHISKTGSFRFLYHVDGKPVAAIQVIQKSPDEAIVSNIYTDENYRRQGLATKLYNYAKNHFPNLQYTSHLTKDGEEFRRTIQ